MMTANKRLVDKRLQSAVAEVAKNLAPADIEIVAQLLERIAFISGNGRGLGEHWLKGCDWLGSVKYHATPGCGLPSLRCVQLPSKRAIADLLSDRTSVAARHPKTHIAAGRLYLRRPERRDAKAKRLAARQAEARARK